MTPRRTSATTATETVGNDKTTQVGVNRDVSIGSNDTETVGVNRSLTVGANETIGDRREFDRDHRDEPQPDRRR